MLCRCVAGARNEYVGSISRQGVVRKQRNLTVHPEIEGNRDKRYSLLGEMGSMSYSAKATNLTMNREDTEIQQRGS